MNIDYKNNKVKEQCTNLKKAKKDFPEKVALKLLRLINFIEAADNLNSVVNHPIYNFHDLKGKEKGLYAMDIDGRKSSYRLIVTFNDVAKEQVFTNSISIETIKVEEVSKHYE